MFVCRVILKKIDYLVKQEITRLRKQKDVVVKEEDFMMAKQMKARIEKLELRA